MPVWRGEGSDRSTHRHRHRATVSIASSPAPRPNPLTRSQQPASIAETDRPIQQFFHQTMQWYGCMGNYSAGPATVYWSPLARTTWWRCTLYRGPPPPSTAACQPRQNQRKLLIFNNWELSTELGKLIKPNTKLLGRQKLSEFDSGRAGGEGNYQ